MEAVLRTLLGATHPSFKNPFTSAFPMAGAFDYSFELQPFGLFFFLTNSLIDKSNNISGIFHFIFFQCPPAKDHQKYTYSQTEPGTGTRCHEGDTAYGHLGTG